MFFGCPALDPIPRHAALSLIYLYLSLLLAGDKVP